MELSQWWGGCVLSGPLQASSVCFIRGFTVHLDIIKLFFIVTNGCTVYLLRSILKFTLKFT